MQLDVHFQLVELIDARVGWRLRAWLAFSPACCMGSAASTGSAILQGFFADEVDAIRSPFIHVRTRDCNKHGGLYKDNCGHRALQRIRTAPFPPGWHMRSAVARTMCPMLVLSHFSLLSNHDITWLLAARERLGRGMGMGMPV